MEKDYDRKTLHNIESMGQGICATQAVTPLTLIQILEQRREHYLRQVASLGDAIKLLKSDSTLEERFGILHTAITT